MNTPATAEAITVRNPWYNPRSAYTQGLTITYKGRSLFSHRGVEVYRNVRGSYDYVIAGCAIDQRAGFSRDNAAALAKLNDEDRRLLGLR